LLLLSCASQNRSPHFNRGGGKRSLLAWYLNELKLFDEIMKSLAFGIDDDDDDSLYTAEING
jgi:hypothetical protein